MPLLEQDDALVAEAVAGLVDCNPFLPERVALERRAVGRGFVEGGAIWHADGDDTLADPNRNVLFDRAEAVVLEAQRYLIAGIAASERERAVYRSAVLYVLWLRYEDELYRLIDDESPTAPVRFYDRFAADVRDLLGCLREPEPDPAHLFAVAFQARRAFHHIFRKIFGGSLPAARLRAAVWQSIFTIAPSRYRAHLCGRMRDIPTLITGESGTGKDLVARAIALSQYVPFDPVRKTFAANPNAGYFALNLSALSPTIIESELFGHRRGAFTGADAEREGWFQRCGPHGTVFLDEVGDLDPAIQVKLLRVLQNREFQRLGETATRRFEGKLVAATHRDLDAEIAAGRFRADLYYRICADVVTTPTLREQLANSPKDLSNLIFVVAQRIVGPEAAPAVTAEVTAFVRAKLPADYPWPGNMRELEQCVRAVVVHGAYRPQPVASVGADEKQVADLARQLRVGEIRAEDLVRRYVGVVFAETGSQREVSRRLGLDRRTVRRFLGDDGDGIADENEGGRG